MHRPLYGPINGPIMTLYMVDPKRRCFITGLDGAEVMMGFGI